MHSNDLTKVLDIAAISAEIKTTPKGTEINSSSSSTSSSSSSASSFDNLKGSATITDSSITVTGIKDATLTNDTFNLTRSKITLTTTGTPTLDQKFAAIQSSLSGMLDITLTAFDTTSASFNKNVVVTIVVKDIGSDYVVASTQAIFSKVNGNLSVSVPAGNTIKMGTSSNGTTFTASKSNAGANTVTSSNPFININATNIINEFATNALIGDTIKQYMVDYTTKAGAYDVYLLINDSSGELFIGSNSILITDTTILNGLNTLVAVSYNHANAKAVKVHFTVQ